MQSGHATHLVDGLTVLYSVWIERADDATDSADYVRPHDLPSQHHEDLRLPVGRDVYNVAPQSMARIRSGVKLRVVDRVHRSVHSILVPSSV